MFAKFLIWAIGLAAIAPVLCCASTLSYSGAFGTDNQEQEFSVVVGSGSNFLAETGSYAEGGFAPELSLFDPAGQLLAIDDTGGTAPNGCGTRGVDPSTHFCFDASLPTLQLSPGTYSLVITEQGNNPEGALTDGFSEDAAHGDDPSFTGTNAGLPGLMFLDPGNFSQRTNKWAVEITGAGIVSVSAVPEPASGVMLGSGSLLIAIGFAGRRLLNRKQERN